MKVVLTKIFKYGIILIGVLLLIITFLGEFTELGKYKSQTPRKWEQFDYNMVLETKSIKQLEKVYKKPIDSEKYSPEVKMRELFNIVNRRLTHGDKAVYNFYSNWFLATVGIFIPAVKSIKIPDDILKYGHSVLCGQAAFVLMEMANRNGIKVRHVGLNGHVVMEAWYDGSWHLFDPDFEVNPTFESGYPYSVSDLSNDLSLVVQNYAKIKDDVTISELSSIYLSKTNNVTGKKGLKWYSSKMQWLYGIQKLSELLKYILPIILILIGIKIKASH